MLPDRLWSLAETAAYLGCSVTTLQRLKQRARLAAGGVRFVQTFPGSRVQVDPRSIDAAMKGAARDGRAIART